MIRRPPRTPQHIRIHGPSALLFKRCGTSSSSNTVPPGWLSFANAPARKREEDAAITRVRTESRPGFLDPVAAHDTFAAPYYFSSVYAREHIVSASTPILPTALLDDATGIIASDAHVRHGRRVSLFEETGKRCLLCEVPTVDAGFNAHTQNYMHQARLAVVERGIALVNWHLRLLSQAMQQVAQRQQHGALRSSAGNAGSLSGASNRMERDSAHDNEEGYGRDYVFRYGVGGLPNAQLVKQSPQILKEVNWATVLAYHWWSMIDIHPSPPPLPDTDAATAEEYEQSRNVRTCDFNRIPSLSSLRMTQRKWRIRYLLRFLMQRGLLRDSLQLSDDRSTSGVSHTFTRTARFERCEMIGDSVMKYVLRDRLLRIFPVHEGGLTARLGGVQQMLDSNPGLLAIYDYLELDGIVGARLPNTKAKADVVEALFGELQTFLLASDAMCGVEHYNTFLDRERAYVRALVEHVLQELAHLIIMWRLEETVTNARAFIEANTIAPWLLRGGSDDVNTSRSSDHHKSRRSDLAVEESIDRKVYDPLPLLTVNRRTPPNQLPPGKETWYHAKHIAPTSANPWQELHRGVSTQPIPHHTAQALRHHYLNGTLRVLSKVRRQRPLGGQTGTASRAEIDRGEDKLQPSLGALRFPRWKAEEEARRQLQDTSRQLTTGFLLSPREITGVLEAELKRFIDAASTSDRQTQTTIASTFPDFTPTPQPPLHNAKQHECLLATTNCLEHSIRCHERNSGKSAFHTAHASGAGMGRLLGS